MTFLVLFFVVNPIVSSYYNSAADVLKTFLNLSKLYSGPDICANLMQILRLKVTSKSADLIVRENLRV